MTHRGTFVRVSSLMILASSVFEMLDERRTHRQTEMKTLLP